MCTCKTSRKTPGACLSVIVTMRVKMLLRFKKGAVARTVKKLDIKSSHLKRFVSAFPAIKYVFNALTLSVCTCKSVIFNSFK